MRIQRFSTALRTFTSSFRYRPTPLITKAASQHPSKPSFPISKSTALKAAPGILPFLSSFFTSTAKPETENNSKMSYPDQRSTEEWRAVLSPGSSQKPTQQNPN